MKKLMLLIIVCLIGLAVQAQIIPPTSVFPNDTSFTSCQNNAYRALNDRNLAFANGGNDFQLSMCLEISDLRLIGDFYSIQYKSCPNSRINGFEQFGSCFHSATLGESENLNYNPQEPNICLAQGSVIDMVEKTVSESIPIDGTEINLVYSSDFNPKRLTNKSIYYEFPSQFIGGTQGISIRTESDNRERYNILNNIGPILRQPWDEVIGNTSVHPALNRAKFSIILSSCPVGFSSVSLGTTVSSYRLCTIVNGATVCQTSQGGSLIDSCPPANVVKSNLGVYYPEVWGLSGWTISNHHFFDRESKTVFDGSGIKSVVKIFRTIELPNYGMVDLVSSHYSDEIYVFDLRGKHLETRTKILSAVKYKFSYDINDKLLGFTDINNKFTQIFYNTAGNLERIAAPYGQQSLFVIENAQIKSVTDSVGQIYEMLYDANNLMTVFKKPNLEVTDFQYDEYGDFTQELKNSGKLQSFLSAFSAFDKFITHATATGIKFIYSVTNDRETITFAKNGAGELISTTRKSETSSEQVTTIDSVADYFKKADPMWGQFISRTPSQVAYSTIGQNSLERGSQDEVFVYANGSDPTSLQSVTITNRNFARTANERSIIDVANRTIISTDSLNRTSRMLFNQIEQIIRIEPVTGFPTDISYNSNGQLSRIQKGTTFEAYGYDQNGYVNTITNSKNQTTTFVRDQQGKVLTKVLPNQEQIGFEYSAGNSLKKIVTSGNQIHNFDMSIGDYISGYLNPDNKNTVYSYDEDKRPIQISKPSGKVLRTSYKLGTNFVEKIETALGNYNFNLDVQGRPLAAKSADNITTEMSWIGSNIKEQRWYDNDGSLIGKITNGYDPAVLRISTIKINDTLVSIPFYNSTTGALSGLAVNGRQYYYNYERPNTTTEQIRISSGLLELSYLSTEENDGSGSSQMVTANATENPVGQLFITLFRGFDNFGSAKEYSTTTINNGSNVLNSMYQLIPKYDENNRLVQIQKNRKSFIDNQVVSATDYFNNYDFKVNSNNNVKEFNQQITTSSTAIKRTIASHGADDRLLSLRGSINRNYAYDLDGNLKTLSNCHGNTDYEYDDFSNLKKISFPNGKIVEYKVDGFNRRVKKLVNGNVVEYYLWYDQLRLAAVLNENKIAKITFTYGPESRTANFLVKDGVTYRILHDPSLGSVKYIVNTINNQIVQELEYDESGNIMKDTNAGFQPLGYAGGLMDSDTKLIRFGARDYDPTVGRWTTKDPIGFAGGDTNLYSYVGQNPMSYVDPSGLDSELALQVGAGFPHVYLRVFDPSSPSGYNVYTGFGPSDGVKPVLAGMTGSTEGVVSISTTKPNGLLISLPFTQKKSSPTQDASTILSAVEAQLNSVNGTLNYNLFSTQIYNRKSTSNSVNCGGFASGLQGK